MRPPIELLDEDRFVRLAAIERSASQQNISFFYALRGVIAEDPDAMLRTRALERVGLASVRRLGGPMLNAVCEAARFALADPSMLVREAAARTVGRLRDQAAPPLLLRALELDPQWRVRRAAARSLAEIQRADALDALVQALDDPFWRVRHAVIQCLSAWPTALPDIDDGGSARRRAALQYLRRASVLGSDFSGPEHEQSNVGLAGFDAQDPDPAVLTLQVRRMPAVRLSAPLLVDCLASPHDELRRAAIQKLTERSNVDELLLAIGHLNEPRTPYASRAVERLMSHVDRSPVVERTLFSAETMGPGALEWALEQLDEVVLATMDEEREGALSSRVEQLAAHPDWRVRRAAVRAWPVAPGLRARLTMMLKDPSAEVREQVLEALASVLPQAELCALVRSLSWQVEDLTVATVAVRLLDDAGDGVGLRVILENSPPSSWLRAHALLALSQIEGALSDEERRAARTDPDPWVRLAVLDLEHAVEVLETDPDPQLRRAAADLARLSAQAMTTEQASRAAAVACRDDDPWIRAVSSKLFDARQPADLLRLLALSRDRSLMARSAAVEALEKVPLVMDRCMTLLSSNEPMDEATRLALHSWLAREGAARGLAVLKRELERPDLSDSAADTLRALSLIYPAELAAGSGIVFAPRQRRPANSDIAREAKQVVEVPKRRLGRTGLSVAPLAISGAFDLAPSSYAAAREAGVNVFFWEPEYRGLGEFLARRRTQDPDLVVVAGSYEADERTIVRDAERALRRLRADCLGVFLLFWVRSPARLSDEAWEAMRALQRAGKVRAIGFSTHARELAVEAIGSGRWDVVMARHSAAHVGAEQALLPCAIQQDVGVLAFSSLVYGRMLVDPRDGSAIPASSCYRYSLSQPGVGAVLSAPRTHHELMENLEVLTRPKLDPTAILQMREHGARVHDQNRAFQRLIRSIDG